MHVEALLVYWVAAPALFAFLFIGLGLLIRYLAGGLRLELVLPLGIATGVVVSSAFTYFSATAALTTPAIAVASCAGYVTALRQIRQRQVRRRDVIRDNTAWIIATFAAFAVFAAPVVLSGSPSFTGYTWIVDIAHQFDLADYVSRHGRQLPTDLGSSYLTQASKNLEVGYPTGIQAVLGSLSRTGGFEIPWAYQPLLALLSAAMVPAAAALLRPLVPGDVRRAVGAFAVSQASILVAYAQAGGIKELTAATLVLLAAATVTRAFTGERAVYRDGVPFAIASAAAFSVLSLTMLPWIGLIALVGVLSNSPTRAVYRVGRATATVAVALLLAAPALAASTRTGDAVSVVQSQDELGNLAAPVSRMSASGIWISQDHRYPLSGSYRSASFILGGLTSALSLIGAVAAVRRRSYELVVLAAAGAGSLAFIVALMGPWVELKALAITAPITVILAVAGISTVATWRMPGRIASALLATAIAAALIGADGLRYRNATLAPYARFSELAKIGKEIKGSKLTLIPDFEETGEYFTRQANGMSSVNPPLSVGFSVRPEAQPGVAMARDLDEFEPSWIGQFDNIIVRRTPGISRPPGNFELRTTGRFYTVWRRTTDSPPVGHSPLSGQETPADASACRGIVQQAKKRGLAARIAPAAKAYNAIFNPQRTSRNFVLSPGSDVARVIGPGQARGFVMVPETDWYDVFVGSNARRPLKVSVDGNNYRVSDNSYASRAVFVARVHLRAGARPVAIARPGGSLAPGSTDGPNVVAGPVTLVRSGREYPPLRVSGSPAACSNPADWVETVEPASR